MSLPYPTVSNYTSSLNTGSYLSPTDHSLLVNGYPQEYWYGFSEMDVIELSAYDLNENPLGWDILDKEKSFKTITLSYIDQLDFPVTYSFQQLVNDLILYKNQKILVNPIEQLSSSFGIIEGSYLVSYNFVRNMAGTPSDRLVVKDISPSRKELKIIPSKTSNPRYEAFCNKKLQIKDISPLLIQLTKQCPYDTIYNNVKDKFEKDIEFIKGLFFLVNDGSFVNFLKNIYEDLIIYTRPTDVSNPVEKISREQGIRTYFTNYILSNSETISDFQLIYNQFVGFTSQVVEKKFLKFGKQESNQYKSAKQFLNDFFVKYFYAPVVNVWESYFNEKYYSYLKNGINFGNGRILPIIDHSFIDERINPLDPLTLIVKLSSELPTNIAVRTECWISNISLVPYVINVLLRNPTQTSTVKISSPNFSINISNASISNVNKSYTFEDLNGSNSVNQQVDINKKINELTVDYTDFTNFIVFSSAELRLKIFKNKVIQLSSLSASLDRLEFLNSQSISNGSVYPFYSMEKDTFQKQVADIVTSFDGYESYLYNSNNYAFSGATFISSSYVNEQDSIAREYDKNNRDSLVNNTPEHVVLDSENDEYLIFLSMIGHFFDNLYLYITNIPIEKTVSNDLTKTFSKKIIDLMLESFGWKLDDSTENLNISENYVVSSSLSLSAENRLKSIRARILSSLPQIYKTKGTEESVKLLLSCYGIPSTLLSIREYGGEDFNSDSSITYTKNEDLYLTNFIGNNEVFLVSFIQRPDVRTLEFKISVNDIEKYPIGKTCQVFQYLNAFNYPLISSSSYFTNISWQVGFYREKANLGKFYFDIGSGSAGRSSTRITSSLLPIFNGEIYNVMFRKNEPDVLFQNNTDTNLIPTKYDLVVQRNELGRTIHKSSNSKYLEYPDNTIFEGVSLKNNEVVLNSADFIVGDFGYGQTKFYGKMSNIILWDVPISDDDFEIHCNDINSFSYSGSDAYKHRILHLRFDNPIDLFVDLGNGFSLKSISNYNEYYETLVNVFPGYSGSFTGDHAPPTDPSIYDILAFTFTPQNFDILLNTSSCLYYTHSISPYQFQKIMVPQTYMTRNYGPNRFKNEKINKIEQTVSTRLDSEGRSTFTSLRGGQSDSNFLGLFADPQDSKNLDIIRYFGGIDITEIIGDPSNLYSSSYVDLTNIRKNYDKSGNKRVLFNELITLYKFYFNRSIFDAIKNVVPARTNVVTGILIEPSVLERPKYQYRSVSSEINSGSVNYLEASVKHYFRDTASLVNLKETLQFAEFNLDISLLSQSYFNTSTIPSNLYFDVNVSYINTDNRIYPVNYGKSVIGDLADKFQLGHYGLNLFNNLGEMFENDLDKSYHPSGSERHFLLKKWSKYSIYSKIGPQVRGDNPDLNLYESSSIYLYELISVPQDFYSTLIYTSSFNSLSSSSDVDPYGELTYIGGTPYYVHLENTFKNSSNMTTNNLLGTYEFTNPDVRYVSPFSQLPLDTYFEIFKGYPRNHYTHKSQLFSPVRFKSLGKIGNEVTSGSYIRSSQNISTTIGSDGLNDGSLPIESINTSNVTLIQSNNVINK